MFRLKLDRIISSLSWNSVRNEVLLVGVDGYFAFWSDFVDPKLLKHTSTYTIRLKEN